MVMHIDTMPDRRRGHVLTTGALVLVAVGVLRP
jgi:hypothetical protein